MAKGHVAPTHRLHSNPIAGFSLGHYTLQPLAFAARMVQAHRTPNPSVIILNATTACCPRSGRRFITASLYTGSQH